MYGIIVKGTKGLQYTDGRRMYFPDRKWQDARVGIFTDMRITVDKDTYAFFTGKMLEVEPLSIDEVFTIEEYEADATYKSLDVDNGNVIAISCDGETGIYAKVASKVIKIIDTDDLEVNSIGIRVKQHIADFLFTAKGVDVSSYLLKHFSETCKLGDKKRALLACIRIMASRPHASFKDFTIFSDAFIVAKAGSEFFSTEMVYAFDKDDELKFIAFTPSVVKGTKTGRIDVAEVENICVNNMICLYSGYAEADKLVVTNKLSALGHTSEVFAWNGNLFTWDCLENEQVVKQINDAKEQHQALLKRLGKQCSSKMITELRKLNLKAWLLHK